MDSETRKRELAIIRDYRERAKTEKSAGWSCTIEDRFDCVEVMVSNPDFPNDYYHFRYGDSEKLLAEIPEWVSAEMSQEDYILALLVNW